VNEIIRDTKVLWRVVKDVPFERLIELFGISMEARIPSYLAPPWVTKDIKEPTYGKPAPSAMMTVG
jgi:hypothetical protein